MTLVLFPEILSRGGIQRFGEHLAAVMARDARARGEGFRFLSLNDARGPHTVEVAGEKVVIEGFGRSRARFALAALAAMARASYVFIGHPNLAELLPIAKLARPGLRSTVIFYGTDGWTPLSPRRRRGCARATGLVAISAHTADRTADVQQLPRSRFRVLPLALDPSIGHRSTQARPLPPTPTFLAVARLDAAERYKGIDATIRALARVLPRVPNARLVVAGDGDDRPRLEELARSLGVARAVEFTGRIDDDALAERYHAATAMVLPSLGEGFGLVYLEALSFGRPVVATNVGAPAEFLRDQEHGILVPPGDELALASAMERLATDRKSVEAWGMAGRAHARSEFSFELFERRLLAIVGEDR